MSLGNFASMCSMWESLSFLEKTSNSWGCCCCCEKCIKFHFPWKENSECRAREEEGGGKKFNLDFLLPAWESIAIVFTTIIIIISEHRWRPAWQMPPVLYLNHFSVGTRKLKKIQIIILKQVSASMKSYSDTTLTGNLRSWIRTRWLVFKRIESA